MHAWQWLVDCADSRLMLNVNLNKGRGRSDIVEVVKQPTVESQGLIARIKSFASGVVSR